MRELRDLKDLTIPKWGNTPSLIHTFICPMNHAPSRDEECPDFFPEMCPEVCLVYCFSALKFVLKLVLNGVKCFLTCILKRGMMPCHCVKSLRSSYTELYPQSVRRRVLKSPADESKWRCKSCWCSVLVRFRTALTSYSSIPCWYLEEERTCHLVLVRIHRG